MNGTEFPSSRKFFPETKKPNAVNPHKIALCYNFVTKPYCSWLSPDRRDSEKTTLANQLKTKHPHTMARMLADRDSSELHLNLAGRHQRLARRYQQTALVTAIGAAIADLTAKKTLTEDKELDRQAAYDNVQAADGDLDDAIRNLFAAAQTFDRDNLGAGTVTMLFPGGGFGDLVEQPVAQETTSADALCVKVESLGSTHALFGHAAKIKTLAQSVRDALASLEAAIRAAKNAGAEEEIAQAALRRQYEGNYLTSRQSLGRSIAERLFPKANSASRNEQIPVTPVGNGAGA